jgi:hypothetical protein
VYEEGITITTPACICARTRATERGRRQKHRSSGSTSSALPAAAVVFEGAGGVRQAQARQAQQVRRKAFPCRKPMQLPEPRVTRLPAPPSAPQPPAPNAPRPPYSPHPPPTPLPLPQESSPCRWSPSSSPPSSWPRRSPSTPRSAAACGRSCRRTASKPASSCAYCRRGWRAAAALVTCSSRTRQRCGRR